MTNVTPEHRIDAPRPLQSLDFLGIALLAAVLLAFSYLQSRHRIFWGDEIMGVYTLDAGSWAGFLERWRAGIDSSGFWFYVLAKPWVWLFGTSEVSLRMFSGAGIAIAGGLIWGTARRFYSTLVVAAAVPVVFLNLAVLRWQLSNGRCYGVFLSAAALVLYLMFRGETDRVPRLPFLLATALAYDILAGSHILGVLYAGALLGMQIALDLRAKRLRLPLYGAAIAGMAVVFLFSLGNIRSTTALGKPVFWTARPQFSDLFLSTDLTDNPLRYLIVVLIALTLISLRRRPARSAVYTVLLGFVALDLLFFAISRVTTSIYVDRYLLPFALALILLIAELLTQLREAEAPYLRLRSLAPVALLLIGLIVMPLKEPFPLPVRDYTRFLLDRLPPGLPVVVTDVGTFVETEYYHHDRTGRPFLFPIDPGVEADRSNPGGVSGFHEMDNFRRLGLDMPDLQTTDVILSRYPRLLIITAEEPTTWFAKRILNTHQYAVRDLGPSPGMHAMHLWEAERVQSPEATAALR